MHEMAELDDRCGDRDSQSAIEFEEFYRSEYRAIVAMAYGLSGNICVAEELAQEGFIALLRLWSGSSTVAEPSLWIRRVVVNLSVSRYRRVRAERRALQRVAGRREEWPGLPEPEAAFWRLARSLPRRQAQVVVLHYLDDRPVKEIAAILGCEPATVKVHLHRARRALAQRLGYELEEAPNV
jgi:RNA polymerase sigma-70 factor (ECF subfamily)